MKILTTVWNLFEENRGELAVSRNGGSIMIYNICNYIGEKVDSFVFVGSMPIGERKVDNVNVLDNRKYLPNDKSDIKAWHYGLQQRMLEVLDEIKPGCVLVQGGGDFSYNCFYTCRKANVPFAFVDHLYAGKNKASNSEIEDVNWEEKAFNFDNLDVVAVGKSMGEAIVRDYPKLKDKVKVISNGTPYYGEIVKSDLKKKLGVSEKKILLCSGSLQPRKNQLQLVRAFALLPDELKNKIAVLFCGSDSKRFPTKEKLINEITTLHLSDSLKYIGTYSTEEMKEVYSVADGLVMPSLSEGLSLVALEMISYGKPIIMFEDNETAGDIDDKRVALLVHEHTDIDLANAIAKWYSLTWDEAYIKDYSRYYNMSRVADEYIEYCKEKANYE